MEFSSMQDWQYTDNDECTEQTETFAAEESAGKFDIVLEIIRVYG